MSRKVVRILDLVDDAALIAAYEAQHRPHAVPADVITDIRDSGYLDMEIWRHGTRLVMVAEVADDFPRPTASRLQPAVDAWQAKMAGLQQRIEPDAQWLDTQRIFALRDQ